MSDFKAVSMLKTGVSPGWQASHPDLVLFGTEPDGQDEHDELPGFMEIVPTLKLIYCHNTSTLPMEFPP